MRLWPETRIRRFRGRKLPQVIQPRIKFDMKKISHFYDDLECDFVFFYDCSELGHFIPWRLDQCSRKMAAFICNTFNFGGTGKVLHWIRHVSFRLVFATKRGRRN